jgi:large subunit ribosomal protein L19e
MNLNAQKRMAAEILKCGETRIWFDEYSIEDIKMAITREDVRSLIKDGAIKKKYQTGISKFRKNKLHERKKKGRARGFGSRKGKKGARAPKKQEWKKKIRPIRSRLKILRDRKTITASTYRKLYKEAKGNMFHSVNHLERYIKEHNLTRRGR